MRRTWAIIGSAVVTLGLVSGCGTAESGADPDPAVDLVETDVSPTSTPLFLEQPQGDLDELPEEAAFASADPASVRYQGMWERQAVYLAVSDDYRVELIVGVVGDESTWASNSSDGNVVIGLGVGDTGEVGSQYVPHGSDDPPEGWTALSDFIIVRQ